MSSGESPNAGGNSNEGHAAKIRKGPRGRIITDDEKLGKRLVANRKSAAASRARRLNLIEDLQKTVAEMGLKIDQLKRENYDL